MGKLSSQCIFHSPNPCSFPKITIAPARAENSDVRRFLLIVVVQSNFDCVNFWLGPALCNALTQMDLINFDSSGECTKATFFSRAASTGDVDDFIHAVGLRRHI